MEFEEAKELLSIVYDSFPYINKKESKTFNKTWIKQIMKGDYEKTSKKLEEYLTSSKFPPSLADFVVLPPKEIKRDDTVDKYKAEVQEELKDPAAVERRKELLDEMYRLINGGDKR